MAWNVKVKVDPATNRYRADATWADDTTGDVESYWLEGILDPKLSRDQQALTIADNVQAQHECAQEKKRAVGTLETDVEAVLDARELKGVVRA